MTQAPTLVTDPVEAKKLIGTEFVLYENQLFYKSEGKSNNYNFPGVWFPCQGVRLDEFGEGKHYIVKCTSKDRELCKKVAGECVFYDHVNYMWCFIGKFDSRENIRRSHALGGWDECRPTSTFMLPTPPDELYEKFQEYLRKLVNLIRSKEAK